MDHTESLAHLKRLLGLLPGVELAWGQDTNVMTRLGLAISNPLSLAILAHIAVAANVPLCVEVAWNCPGGHDDASCVRYDLRIPKKTDLTLMPPSNLQLVGGMLARKLKEQGLLTADEADQLQRDWNFEFE